MKIVYVFLSSPIWADWNDCCKLDG